MSEMFSGKHDESEPCDGCGKVPSVHMGHGSYSCKTCFEEAFCEKCKYMKSADGSHECPSPEEHARRKAEFEFFARDASGEEPLLKACMRLRGEIATLTADRDRLREECARVKEALRDMTARAMGHAYASSMAEGGEDIKAQELAYERQQHKETLAELRATEQMVFDLKARVAAAEHNCAQFCGDNETLEKKLAVAIAERDRLGGVLANCTAELAKMEPALNKAIAERDEARAEAERLRAIAPESEPAR